LAHEALLVARLKLTKMYITLVHYQQKIIKT
jgi:hypothetical protein